MPRLSVDIDLNYVKFDSMKLARQLFPTLRVNSQEFHVESTEYGARLVRECREGLSAVLPFTGSAEKRLGTFFKHRFLCLILTPGL